MEFVLRYHVPNQHKDPKAYAHHLLFKFYPFCNEEELKAGESNSYCAKLQEPGVVNIIIKNKSLVESFGDLVNEAFLNFRSDLPPSWNQFIHQENNDANSELLQGEDNAAQESDDDQHFDMPHSVSGNTAMSAQIHTILSNNDLSIKIRSLNMKQRYVFDFIYNWAKLYMISKSGCGKILPVPFFFSLSGGGRCEKLSLMKTIYHSVNKLFLYQRGNPDKLRLFVLVPTRVAANNIKRPTIHSSLNIPCQGY